MKAESIDYIIIAAYLIGVAAFGILSGGKQKKLKIIFLALKKFPGEQFAFLLLPLKQAH